ncbi:MAG: amino acid ABC transporter permease [Sporichthyaceae bacterium]
MSSVLYDAPGPVGRRRILIASVATGAALLAVVVLVALRLEEQGQFESERWRPMFDPRHERFTLVWTFLGTGLRRTLQVAAWAMAFSLVLGVLFAVVRIHAGQLSPRAVSASGGHTPSPARRYTRQVSVRAYRGTVVGVLEVLRGLPVIISIFFAARTLPQAGIELPLMWYLVIGLTAYNSVIIGEIVRAGVQSLPRGQAEAAYAMGLTRAQTLRLILLPQAFRVMLPAMISQLVVVLKDTSLGFFIAYEELLRRGNIAIQTLQNPLQMYLLIGAMYIAINYALSRLAVFLERRLSGRALPREP